MSASTHRGRNQWWPAARRSARSRGGRDAAHPRRQARPGLSPPYLPPPAPRRSSLQARPARRSAAPGSLRYASRSISARSNSHVAPGTWKAGRTPFGRMGKMVADVWALFLADQPGGVDPVPGHGDDHDVAEQVVAERAEACTLAPSLARSTPVPAAGARGGGPDLGEPGAALAGRDRLDRTAQHVQDVRAEHRHLSRAARRSALALTRACGSWLAAAPLAVAAAPDSP